MIRGKPRIIFAFTYKVVALRNKMDDSRFDKSIREKPGKYEAQGFDPAALASLHHQMAAISFTPWYATYRTGLLVGSATYWFTLK